jgi:hypothetical protein
MVSDRQRLPRHIRAKIGLAMSSDEAVDVVQINNDVDNDDADDNDDDDDDDDDDDSVGELKVNFCFLFLRQYTCLILVCRVEMQTLLSVKIFKRFLANLHVRE